MEFGGYMSSIQDLAKIMRDGYPENVTDDISSNWKSIIDSLFLDRFYKNSAYEKRVALIPDEDKVSFAGLIHPDNPKSGAYSGMCLVWFPTRNENMEEKSLIAFGCGTRGLAPDEGIIARPGHARLLSALGKLIQEKTNSFCWCKQDPANLIDTVPDIIRQQFPDFSDVFNRYGNVLYFICEIPNEVEKSEFIVQAMVDYYAIERNWRPKESAKSDIENLVQEIQKRIFERVTEEKIYHLLKERLYIILQGPPGTGKTRLAQNLMNLYFSNKSKSIQFHPTTTYENFISGIQPKVKADELSFGIYPGFLLKCLNEKEQDSEFLLVIDEINRADLGKVLGESIALFEFREVRENKSREIDLPYPTDEISTLTLPSDFYILGTMNTADRSIAIMDLAVRRRFAFINIWPQRGVVDEQNLSLASEAFEKLLNIFIQFASDENLVLLPGHSYFLAENESELKNRFKYELIPLLQDYILDGRITAMNSHIQGFIDWLQMRIT